MAKKRKCSQGERSRCDLPEMVVVDTFKPTPEIVEACYRWAVAAIQADKTPSAARRRHPR